MMDVPMPPDLDGWKVRQAEFDVSKSSALDSEDKTVNGKPNFQLPVTTTSADWLDGVKKEIDDVAKILGKPWTY